MSREAEIGNRIAGICDCHVHVFGSPNVYPFANALSYEPPYSPLSVLQENGLNAGIGRFVIVQPIPYGQDLSLLTTTLLQLGDRARGVAVVDGSASLDDLARMKEAGIRGLRFVETPLADQSRMPGTVPLDDLFEHLAPKLSQLDMHAEIWAPLATILSQWSRIEACHIPIVLDHMGGFDVSLGVTHRDFQFLLDLLSDEKVWIKLAVCRRQLGDASFAAVRPFHDALIAAGDGKLIWASDFPFVRYPAQRPEIKDLLGLFRDWVDDPVKERRILVDNPTKLYWRS